jgi:hypothetical protein
MAKGRSRGGGKASAGLPIPQLSAFEFARMTSSADRPQALTGLTWRLVPTKGNAAFSVSASVPYRDVVGRLVNGAIRFACRVDMFNRLIYNGAPIGARSLAYYFSSIQWRAGQGWPVYSSRCPQPDKNSGFPFPDANRHSIVPIYGGYYWPGCSNSGGPPGDQTTDVFVGVNDDRFVDNTGGFEFVVTGYAP